MVSLRYFLFVLLVLCGREYAANQANANAVAAWAMTAAMLISFTITMKFAALQALARATMNGSRVDWLARELFGSSRVRVERIWCSTAPAVMLLCGWNRWTVELQHNGWAQTLALAINFAPAIFFLLAVESLAAQLDRTDRRSWHSWFGNWLTRIRLGEVAGLFTCIMPVLLFASVSDLAELAHQWWAVDKTLIVQLLTVCLLVGFVLIFPAVLTRWTGAGALPANQLARVTNLMQRAGVRGVQPVLISSRGRWAGAAVVGWVRGFRRLWLGDGLLDTLTAREVDMVVLHELAHVTRWHFVWRILPIVWALGLAAIVWLIGDQFDMGDSIYVKLAAGMSASWLMLVGLGAVARRCEIDADLNACRLALMTTEWAAGDSPAAVLSTALAKLLEGCPVDKATWMHPSLADRQSALAAWQFSDGRTPTNSMGLVLENAN